jgi:hypothetical protein
MIPSAQEFSRLLESADPAEQARARHESADEAVWQQVIADYPDLQIWVVRNKTVPLSILRILARSRNVHVRREVAGKRKLDEALFGQLAHNDDESVRFALLNNPKCPAHIRATINEAHMTQATSTYGDSINLASLERNWPLGRDLPPLIRDVATLLMPIEHGTVGWFEMKGVRFDDYWIENGADLSEQFGFFLILPDGSKVGQWFHDGAVAGAEPVVGIGSEGELEVLAPNLKAFVLRWAEGDVWYDLGLADEDDTPDARIRWAEVGAKMRALADVMPEPPVGAPIADLPNFFADYGTAAIKAMAEHPIHQEIVRVMAAHVPTGEDVLDEYYLQIKIAGDRIELLPNATPETYPKRAPVPAEAPQLIPLILKLREERASGPHAGRGLWHNASLQIHKGELYDLPNPVVLLKGDWEFEPGFETGGRVTKAQLAEDLARFPRDARYREPWMDELQ